MGDRPQGVAGDCNSLAETHAWFDSRVAHHFTQSAGKSTKSDHTCITVRWFSVPNLKVFGTEMTKNKIPHLLFERSRYYYQRRVPIRFQSAIGHKKWREPMGADFPEAIDRVRTLTKQHDALLETLQNPVEFRTAKTNVRRAHEEEGAAQDNKHDKQYERWLEKEGINDDAYFGRDQVSMGLYEAIKVRPWENARKLMKALETERSPAPDLIFVRRWIDAMQLDRAGDTSISLPPYEEYRQLVSDAPTHVRNRISFAKHLPEPIDDDEYHDRLVAILEAHFGNRASRPEDPDDQDEYDLLQQNMERKISRVARDPDTLFKVAESYFGFAQIKPSTRNKYLRTLKRLTNRVGDLPLKHLSPHLLRGFRDYLVEQGNLPASIRADFTPIIGILNFAVDEGLIDCSPMAGVRLPKEKRSIEETKWLPFKPHEMRSILSGVERIWSSELQGLSAERRKGLQMAVRALAYTAMRPSEFLALGPNDIDERCIRIKGGKTKSALRVIPLHPAISDVPAWVQQGGLAVFHNRVTGVAQTDPVTALRHNFSRLTRDLLDEPISGERKALYSLRSTFQNALRRAGAPIEVRRAIMGHVEHGAMRHYDDGPEFDLLRSWVVVADPTVD